SADAVPRRGTQVLLRERQRWERRISNDVGHSATRWLAALLPAVRHRGIARRRHRSGRGHRSARAAAQGTVTMFAVLFEVHPKSDRWDAYLGYAAMLKPELEQIDGFVDNLRYRSLTRDGWLLSLSSWRDEKAVVRWRTRVRHHEVQERGRGDVFLDYHLRVGQLTADTRLPAGLALHEQRLDETEVGAGTTAMLIDASRPPAWVE